MNTTSLIPTTDDGLADLVDDALIELFADAGLTVEIVESCDDASCSECFPSAPARAA